MRWRMTSLYIFGLTKPRTCVWVCVIKCSFSCSPGDDGWYWGTPRFDDDFGCVAGTQRALIKPLKCRVQFLKEVSHEFWPGCTCAPGSIAYGNWVANENEVLYVWCCAQHNKCANLDVLLRASEKWLNDGEHATRHIGFCALLHLHFGARQHFGVV